MLILVTGPHSSGTRLMRRILTPTEAEVRHRTLPFNAGPKGRRMRNIPLAEFDHAVVMSRDWYANAMSQVERGHAGDLGEAFENLRCAHAQLVDWAERTSTPWTMVSFENLIQRPRAVIRWLCGRLVLPVPDLEESVRDENIKHLLPLMA